MHDTDPTRGDSDAYPHAFRTTHWSLIVSAMSEDSAISFDALNHLCRLYWYPVFNFIRKKGYNKHDAQDMTQMFFAKLLEKNWLQRVDSAKGRFRSFLLMILKRFMAGEWKKKVALKRAGNLDWLSLSLQTAETRFAIEPVDTTTPEQSFEKQWALTLLDVVMQDLRNQYVKDGKADLFEALKPCLLGSRESQPYAKIAKDFGMSESALKVTVFRLRKEYRKCLRAEIANTVASSEDVEVELKYLIRVLARG